MRIAVKVTPRPSLGSNNTHGHFKGTITTKSCACNTSSLLVLVLWSAKLK